MVANAKLMINVLLIYVLHKMQKVETVYAIVLYACLILFNKIVYANLIKIVSQIFVNLMDLIKYVKIHLVIISLMLMDAVVQQIHNVVVIVLIINALIIFLVGYSR